MKKKISVKDVKVTELDDLIKRLIGSAKIFDGVILTWSAINTMETNLFTCQLVFEVEFDDPWLVS